jgi:hypothetical protein
LLVGPIDAEHHDAFFGDESLDDHASAVGQGDLSA